MNNADFIKKIEQELEECNNNQICQFACVCAIYSFPFIGSQGNFNYWDEKDRQNFLYSVIFLNDVILLIMAKLNTSRAVIAARAAIAARGAIADRGARAGRADIDAARAARAARAVIDASIAAIDAAIDSTRDATRDAVRDAVRATRAAIAVRNFSNIFKKRILNDLKKIKQNQKIEFSKELYDEIFSNFLNALKKEGCGYWANIYKSIYENKYNFISENIMQRIEVPNEIKAKGAAEVGVYLEEFEKKGGKRLNESRLIILGEKGAGKTCIARKLVHPDAYMTEPEESTAGVDTLIWHLNEEQIRVHIWDFAGHTITHAVHQFFLSERCLYLIVYDGRSEERNRLTYWLDHMLNYGKDSEAIILINKRDNHCVDIPINILKEQYKIKDIYTFSIKDDKKQLESFRSDISKYIIEKPSWSNQQIPKTYYNVKQDLEKLFNNKNRDENRERITKKEFDKIAKKHKVDDSNKLLSDLHDLGISLWYREMKEYNTLILNPEWISQAVYKITNWVHNNGRYSLSLKDFQEIFKDEPKRYNNKDFPFIFKLMQHFELAFQEDSEERLIIPHLLNEDQPSKLPFFKVGESLELRYKADQPLPPNTISRFIVRHHKEIKKDWNNKNVWRYGVILEKEKGSIALVREKDRSIIVSVKGKNKTQFIDYLRSTLNDIFISYKNKKPDLEYKVERYGKITSYPELKEDLWLKGEEIYTYNKKNQPYYHYKTNEEFYLNKTIINYKIDHSNLLNKSTLALVPQNIVESIALENNKQDLLKKVAISGSLGVFVMLFVAIFIPTPTEFQYFIFRVIISISGAGIGGIIPGFINLRMEKEKLFAIRAGGAIALFIITYLINPPSLIP